MGCRVVSGTYLLQTRLECLPFHRDPLECLGVCSNGAKQAYGNSIGQHVELKKIHL